MNEHRFDYGKLMSANDVELQRALNASRIVSWENFGRKIQFYAPSFVNYKTSSFCSSPTAFPSISVTGSSCATKCKHCDGKVLRTMISAPTPQELINICSKIREKGAVGCLISGGCLPDGSVPLEGFTDAIAKIKRDLELTVVVHTGIIDMRMAGKLKEAGVDAALVDVVGSDETIREMYRLEISVRDYDNTLEALHRSGIPTVPHVLVGLHYGKLKGELAALEMIAKYEPSAVIVIALIPIHGTPIMNLEPPTPTDVAKVLVAARLMMPKTPISLGCMRPQGRHKAQTDRLAVASGVNAVAFPSEEAFKLAESMGLEIMYSSLCCSQIFMDIATGCHVQCSHFQPSK